MDQQRLRRVFDILEYLAAEGSANVSSISRNLDMPLSSSHDLLKAMVKTDSVSVQGRNYSLGPRSIRLSFDVLDSLGVQRLAQAALEGLASRTELDVYLAIRTGSKVLYVSRYPGSQSVNIDIPLGRRLFLHSTSVGKLFAALDREMYQQLVAASKPALTPRTRTTMQELDKDLRLIKSRGFSVSRGESVLGISGVAAPIFAPDGRLVAAAHLSVLQAAVTGARLKDAAQELVNTAHDIEQQLAAPIRTSA